MAPHLKDAVPACRIRQIDGKRSVTAVQPDLGACTLTDILDDGVCFVDGDGRIRWINRAMEEFFGIDRDRIDGMPIADFLAQVVSPALIEPESIPEKFSASSSHPSHGPLEIRISSRCEGPLWLEYSTRPFREEEHPPWRVDLFRRINRWKVAEQHFRESEMRYRLLFNKGNDAILVYSLSTDYVPDRIVEVNDTACRHLGYTREELMRLSPLSLIPPELLGTALRTIKELNLDHYVTYPSRRIAKNGRIIPVEISSHLFSMDGEQVVISILRDIAERQRLESLKRNALQQIGHNIEQFATLGDHIRNPLSVIVGLASLEETESSRRILTAAERIDALVTELDRGWIASENVREFLRKHYGPDT